MTASDGTNSTTQDITVSVTDVNDNTPIFTSSDSFAADEGQTSVGTITATDADGDDLSFSISGNDAGVFVIGASTGVLEFVQAFDYENDPSQRVNSIVVTVTDGTNEASQNVTVTLNNINDNSPVFTSSATFSAAENQTAIGTVTATDADGDSVTFSVSGSELEITSGGVLTFASAPDYETKSTYTATVTASDGTNSTTQDITVSVTDVNDNTPIFTSSATFSAAENQTTIGTVTATDADGDDITYSISGSEININSSTGVLTFASAPDYETKATYTATVTASDGTDSTTQDITVNITDVNENAPVFTSSATFTIPENQTPIGIVTATDADGDDITYSISGSEININSSTGALIFASAPDYETKATYTATVTASDGTNSTTQDITVNITDVNENLPVFTSSATFSAAENQTAIGTVTATDADGDDITYSISGSEIAINSSTGVLTFASAPDYETKATYTATVTASDGTDSTTQDITVNVTDVNENLPVFTSSATFSAAENQTAIGTVTATDADGDDITYSISGSEIAINSSTGVLTFASAPDYETKATYTATVTASDGTDSTTQDITVNVTDVNDNSPVFTSSATFSAAENQTAIGTVTATDADGDSVTFSVSGSEININSSTGVLTFASAPDYETKAIYTATVTASDGTNSDSQDITVNVTNVNESQTITSSATFSAAENQTAIGTVTATDADGDSLAFSISGSEIDIGVFSGTLSFASAPDYETKSSYSATVTVTDGSLSTTQDITVSIINVNDNSPVFTSSATFSAAENQTAIGTVTATDADGNVIAYSISGSEITINSSTGVLTFDSAPDYETKATYTATVTASDGANSSTQSITVNVTDVDENTNTQPVATAASHTVNLLPKDQTSKTLTLAGTDADGDSLTYAIVSSPSQGTVSLSGTTVTYQTKSGVTSAQTDTFTFKVNDGTVDSDAATITLDLRTDPLYQYQWHLDNRGQKNFATGASTASFDLNVDTVIAAGYTGDGVLVSVVDEGLELAHEDLADNIVAGSWDYTNGDNDPTRSANDGDHGTSVAGIINSAGWNNKGGRGVAPEASLIGANFLDSNTSQSYEAQSWGVNSSGGVTADIYNLSYGTSYSDVYGMQWTAGDEVGGSTLQDALVYGTTNHRNGKGAVYVKSTGNAFHQDTAANRACGEDSSFVDSGIILSCSTTSYDLKHSFPQTMPVAALGAGGVKSSYSTPGPAVWISGFGGEYGYSSDLYSTVAGTKLEGPAIMTADQTGCTNGYVGANGGQQANIFNDGSGGYSENSNCNYTSNFNGTSSAAPSVSGVVALMLEANPNLTWRDVKHIMASTAVKFDADRTTSLSGIPQYEWETNAAGYNFHNWYGFGKVDAAAAVSMAETYSVDLGTFDSKTAIIGEYSTVAPDFGGLNYSLDFTAPAGSKNFVEFIRVIVNIDHAAPNTFGLRLTSPEGTEVNILQPYTNLGVNPGDRYFPIGVNAFYGEEMTGTWTLNLIDYSSDEVTGVLKNWGMIVYGGKTTSANDNSPVFTSSATFSAAENQTAIGTVTATDADGDSVTFSVSGSELAITSGGVLTFASAPDYETKSTYTATVTATDGTNSTTQDITVNVTDVNENAPVFTSSATFSAAENQTAIGTVTATDADGDSVTFSVSGSELEITSGGVLTFASAPDYETKATYTATVTATDGTNSTTQDITVNVTDVNEGSTNNAPVATAASHTVNLLPKDQTSKTLTLAGTDADGDSLTYAIVSSPSQGTVSLSGTTVTYQTKSGVTSAQTDTFTFKVNDGTVDSDAATITLDLRTDPLYQYQWHLDNRGQKNFATGASTASFDLNVDTVIAAGYTGDGVLVSVVDEGLELAHEDLADNIVAGSWDYTNGDNDPTRSANDGDHGTSVAGIINSAGWNNKGGRGVAPEASLIGANFLDSNTSQSYEAQSWGVNSSGGVTADIYNLSYGTSYSDVYGMQWTAGDEVGGSTLQDALVYGTTNHRNGKGAVYVKSTGNAFHQDTAANRACGEDSSFVDSGIILSCSTTSYDLKHSFPQTMPVAALGAGGVKSSYSTPGPAVWISGFGGEYGYSSDLYSTVAGTKLEGPAIMTADQTGCTNGYVGANGGQQANIFNDGSGGYSENSNCNYTSNFNGTSSAAPSVSGVVALMLEANPNLTWRDVKHIMASTAVKFDADRTTSLSGIPQYEWETNAAGYNFHNWYGFGKVDAAAAVSMAETYSVDLGTFDSKTAIIGEYSTVIEDLAAWIQLPY
ncbi:MAG: cadherin domain-containing protein [Gammaproteobacteria bacterium]